MVFGIRYHLLIYSVSTRYLPDLLYHRIERHCNTIFRSSVFSRRRTITQGHWHIRIDHLKRSCHIIICTPKILRHRDIHQPLCTKRTELRIRNQMQSTTHRSNTKRIQTRIASAQSRLSHRHTRTTLAHSPTTSRNRLHRNSRFSLKNLIRRRWSRSSG